MADQKIDPSHTGLGDITALLSNVGVSDLSWLNVDEEEYRASEALPKQNLDMVPELQQALAMDPDGEGHFIVPARVNMRSHTIVNSNPLERTHSVAAVPPAVIRDKTARYIMAGLAPAVAASNLQHEFAPQDLSLASQDSLKVASERGLLGNVYVDASHFSRCAQDGDDRKFVAKHAKRALFVLAKLDCTGCVHNSGGCCRSLQGKRIVDAVPYDTKVAAHYSVMLSREGRQSDINPLGDVREDLRRAFLSSPTNMSPETVQTVQTLPKAQPVAVTASDIASFLERRNTPKSGDPVPGPIYMHAARRVMLGSADPVSLAASSDAEVRSLASDHGLLGHTFLDMDVLGGCKATLNLIAARNLTPDFIIRRSSSCTHCMDASDGACCRLREVSTLVQSRPTLDRNNFASALKRACSQGRLVSEMAVAALSRAPETSDWKSLTAQANLFQSVDSSVRQYDGPKAHIQHLGTSSDVIAAEMDPEEVRRSISHMMNFGLHGRPLQAAILNRYSKADLLQVPDIGQRLASQEGIQGTWFIDPTAYGDYGHGCSEGASHFRKRGSENVLAGSSCTGCTLQTAPGWCSKYAKNLVRNVPQDIRDSIIASRRRLPVVHATVENPVERYELSAEIELDLPGKVKSVEIEMADRSVE